MVMTQSLDDGGFGWAKAELWKVYLPAMVFGLLGNGSCCYFWREVWKRKRSLHDLSSRHFLKLYCYGVCNHTMGFHYWVLSFSSIGFNMFEPLLQSFVAKFAKVHQKGAALGVANTFAYVGIFFGGLLAGWLMQHYDRATLAIVVAIISIAWFIWVATMPNPNNRGNVYLPLDIFDRNKVAALTEHEAIVESYVNETENIAVVKYEKDMIDEDEV